MMKIRLCPARCRGRPPSPRRPVGAGQRQVAALPAPHRLDQDEAHADGRQQRVERPFVQEADDRDLDQQAAERDDERLEGPTWPSSG